MAKSPNHQINNPMQIEFKTTSQITATGWESYTAAFNQVFKKETTVDYFHQKYRFTIDGGSYHVFLTVGDQVVGACTVIPYEYCFEEKIMRCGLAVDVFIVTEFRNDPLALYRMYKILKKELIQKDIALIIAVPNDVAYPYWKNVVKWKVTGLLNYYVLPVKSATITAKLPVVFNPLNHAYANLMVFLSRFVQSTERLSKIRINRANKIVEVQRYTKDHLQFTIAKTFVSYRIVYEEGINTCYLIDFYNIHKGCKDAASLQQAMQKIMADETVDIIVFIGKLNFFQLLLLKLPFRFEPRHLYLMTDILITEKINTTLISDIRNWDFGLFNYDVR